jgi:hypothetical protein
MFLDNFISSSGAVPNSKAELMQRCISILTVIFGFIFLILPWLELALAPPDRLPYDIRHIFVNSMFSSQLLIFSFIYKNIIIKILVLLLASIIIFEFVRGVNFNINNARSPFNAHALMVVGFYYNIFCAFLGLLNLSNLAMRYIK